MYVVVLTLERKSSKNLTILILTALVYYNFYVFLFYDFLFIVERSQFVFHINHLFFKYNVAYIHNHK